MLTPKTPNPRVGWGLTFLLCFWIVHDISRTFFWNFDPLNHPMGPPWCRVGQICLGSNDSQINPHMRAKYGRGPTVVPEYTIVTQY